MIKNLLPEISREISNNIKEAKEKLRDLGTPMPKDDNEKLQLLWRLVSEFSSRFKNSLTGRYDKHSSN